MVRGSGTALLSLFVVVVAAAANMATMRNREVRFALPSPPAWLCVAVQLRLRCGGVALWNSTSVTTTNIALGSGAGARCVRVCVCVCVGDGAAAAVDRERMKNEEGEANVEKEERGSWEKGRAGGLGPGGG